MEFTTDIDIMRWLIATSSMALLFAGLWLAVKKYNLGTNKVGGLKKIQVIETTHIDARHKAVVMQVEGEEYLTILGPNASMPVKMGEKK